MWVLKFAIQDSDKDHEQPFASESFSKLIGHLKISTLFIDHIGQFVQFFYSNGKAESGSVCFSGWKDTIVNWVVVCSEQEGIECLFKHFNGHEGYNFIKKSLEGSLMNLSFTVDILIIIFIIVVTS